MKFKFINSAWQSLKNTALKFPAFFAGTLVGAVSATLATSASDIYRGQVEALRASGHDYNSAEYKALMERENALSENAGRVLLCAVWCCAASFFAEILCRVVCCKKDIQGKKKTAIHLAAQALCIVLSVPMYFILKAEGDWSPFIYGSTLFIFVVLGLYLLHNFQDEEKIVPNATVSLVMEGITVTCLVAGLALVIFAFQNLVYSFKVSIPYTACFFFSSFVIGLNLLVSYVTRPRELVSVPKAFNVIYSCALLPIYAMLLAVLYIYFGKCIFTRSMPVGMVNPFVSAATAVFLDFYLCLPREGTFSAAGKFFRKWGALFLFPLLALQCFAFAIRIREYGFTVTRVASLYYIIASIIFCILPFVKGGKYMRQVYLVFAFFALLMTLPGTGCISIARFSQASRVERIYKAHSLYKDGKLLAENADSLLSYEEKAAVVSATNELYDFKKKPSWWPLSLERGESYSANFEKAFGFKHHSNYAKLAKNESVDFYYSIRLNLPNGAALDVGEFSTLYSFCEANGKVERGVIPFGPETDSKEVDLTNELTEYLLNNSSKEDREYSEYKEVSEPIVFKKDGWTFIFTRLHISMKDGEQGFEEFYVDGYVCK